MADHPLVRQGPVVSLGLALVLALAALGPAPNEPRPKADAKAKPEPKVVPKAEAKAEEVPIGLRPYKVRVWVAVDPGARLDAPGRVNLIAAWRVLVRRFVGASWDLEVVEGPGPLLAGDFDALKPEAVGPLASGCDKAWFILLSSEDDGFAFSGREFDVATAQVGPLHRRSAPFPVDAPRVLLQLSLAMFRPLAEIGEQSGGGVAVTIQGAGLPAPDPVGRVARVGSVFQPIRIFLKPDGSIRQILDIPHSYLRVETIAGAEAHCGIVSALRDPLTKRVISKNRLIALGIKPAGLPTRFRFVNRADKTPAAGYVLTARSVPDGSPREVGTTDRDGRVVLSPGFAEGLVILRLLAGLVEPLVEIPVMPGGLAEEQTITIDPKPLTIALETEVSSLRDEVMDLVAKRARLEARMKARTNGKAWDEVKSLLDDYHKLPSRKTYEDRIAKIREEAKKQQTKRVAVLTRTAQAQLADLEAMVDRYLQDDAAQAYAEALDAARPAAKATSKASAPGS